MLRKMLGTMVRMIVPATNKLARTSPSDSQQNQLNAGMSASGISIGRLLVIMRPPFVMETFSLVVAGDAIRRPGGMGIRAYDRPDAQEG
jgi:hypothetical protein